MKKRIYLNMLLLLLLSTILLSSSISYIFYNAAKRQEISAIQDRAKLSADLLNRGINEEYIDQEYYDNSRFSNPAADFISNDKEAARMTVIAPDGTVLMDNKAMSGSLENHSNRDEFIAAMETGIGETQRYSDTLSGTTYYYAVKLNDGNILRISKTLNSMFSIFTSVLPVVLIIALLILLLANFIARKLTGNIIKPLSEIDFESDNFAVYDELLPYVKKINQQKEEISQQFLALLNRTETINAITENMKEGLILADRDGTVLSANASALEIFQEKSMIDKDILHICRDIDFLKKMKQCLTGTSSEMSFNRNKKTYHLYLNPVYEGEVIDGAIVLFLDTTEKYKAEKQRREFSANVSHELKTPLSVISGLSEMMEGGMVKSEDIKGFAAKITAQSKRLINIINDIIKLSEFDEGNTNQEYPSFDLYELTQSVITALEDKARERNIELRFSGKPMQITANARMIDELLYNLIDNAIKYNQDGGQVSVAIGSEADNSMISVSDTGIGIAREHHDRIFERFYRVDKSRSKKTGGTGLGLSIVKHIVEHHNGKIVLESTEGFGTIIKCYLSSPSVFVQNL